MEGDYEAAKSYLGARESFNNALVILLNGQPSQSIQMLRKLDETAKTDYLMAVAAARDGDVEIMYNALRAAVAMDPQMVKSRAVKDVEFAAYFEDDLFKEITQ